MAHGSFGLPIGCVYFFSDCIGSIRPTKPTRSALLRAERSSAAPASLRGSPSSFGQEVLWPNGEKFHPSPERGGVVFGVGVVCSGGTGGGCPKAATASKKLATLKWKTSHGSRRKTTSASYRKTTFLFNQEVHSRSPLCNGFVHAPRSAQLNSMTSLVCGHERFFGGGLGMSPLKTRWQKDEIEWLTMVNL